MVDEPKIHINRYLGGLGGVLIFLWSVTRVRRSN
jgi:hypothetical protein